MDGSRLQSSVFSVLVRGTALIAKGSSFFRLVKSTPKGRSNAHKKRVAAAAEPTVTLLSSRLNNSSLPKKHCTSFRTRKAVAKLTDVTVDKFKAEFWYKTLQDLA